MNSKGRERKKREAGGDSEGTRDQGDPRIEYRETVWDWGESEERL